MEKKKNEDYLLKLLRFFDEGTTDTAKHLILSLQLFIHYKINAEEIYNEDQEKDNLIDISESIEKIVKEV